MDINSMNLFTRIDINIMCIVFVGIISMKLSKKLDFKLSRVKLVYLLIALTLWATLTEIFSVIAVRIQDPRFCMITFLLKLNSYICAPLIPYAWGQFVYQFVNNEKKMPKTRQVLLSLPLLILVVLLIFNFSSGFLFNVTGNNVYQRGEYYNIYIVATMTYYLYNIFFTVLNIKKVNKDNIITFIICTFFPVIGAVLQAKLYGLLLLWPGSCICCLFLLINLQKSFSKFDPLTKLLNREAYEYIAEKTDSQKKSKYTILFMDIDNFKEINDKYGYLEGDTVLQVFANTLKTMLPEGTDIIRYDNDTFLAVLYDQTIDTTKVLVYDLENKVSMLDRKYKVEFTYGMSYCKEGISMGNIIKEADIKMYESKLSKKINNYSRKEMIK